MATFNYKLTSTLVSQDEIVCNSPVVVARYLVDHCFDAESMHEEAGYVLLLDKSNHLQGFSRISVGCMDSCCIDARKVAQIALLAGAGKIVLAHNHPSGNVAPSQADMEQTKKVKNIMTVVGIDLVDHIIMSADRINFFAFSTGQKGQLQKTA